MKKLFLLLLLANACSKGGPQFDLTSSDLQLMSVDGSDIRMKREEPENGPTFQIRTQNINEVKKLSKKLVCGPVILEGRSGSSSDLFSFKISQSEFPGLSLLPSRASCVIKVSVDGKWNGLREKEFPIRLQFDSSPKISMTRFVTPPGGFVPLNSNSEFLLERYVIKNNLNYIAGFTYTSGVYGCNVVPAYTMPSSKVCSDTRQNVGASRIKVLGIVEDATGDYVSTLSFKVKPGNEVIVEAYGRVPDSFSRNHTDPVIPVNIFSLSGVSIKQCTDTTVFGLTMWGDFEQKKEDLIQPSKFLIQKDSIQTLPEWNPKGC